MNNEPILEHLAETFENHRRERIIVAVLLLTLCDNDTDLMTDIECIATRHHGTHNDPNVVKLIKDVSIMANDVLPIIQSFVERNNK